jgi:hypothetical protein
MAPSARDLDVFERLCHDADAAGDLAADAPNGGLRGGTGW